MIDNKLLQYADSLAQTQMQRALKASLSPRETLQAATLALRLLQAAYPGTVLEIVDAMNEADATYAAHTQQLGQN